MPAKHTMKLAKAPQAEIDTLMSWLQDREGTENPPPPYMRIVFGYETLVTQCCDPTKDVLDWKPGMSPAEIAALRVELARVKAENEAFLALLQG